MFKKRTCFERKSRLNFTDTARCCCLLQIDSIVYFSHSFCFAVRAKKDSWANWATYSPKWSMKHIPSPRKEISILLERLRSLGNGRKQHSFVWSVSHGFICLILQLLWGNLTAKTRKYPSSVFAMWAGKIGLVHERQRPTSILSKDTGMKKDFSHNAFTNRVKNVMPSSKNTIKCPAVCCNIILEIYILLPGALNSSIYWFSCIYVSQDQRRVTTARQSSSTIIIIDRKIRVIQVIFLLILKLIYEEFDAVQFCNWSWVTSFFVKFYSISNVKWSYVSPLDFLTLAKSLEFCPLICECQRDSSNPLNVLCDLFHWMRNKLQNFN